LVAAAGTTGAFAFFAALTAGPLALFAFATAWTTGPAPAFFAFTTLAAFCSAGLPFRHPLFVLGQVFVENRLLLFGQ